MNGFSIKYCILPFNVKQSSMEWLMIRLSKNIELSVFPTSLEHLGSSKGCKTMFHHFLEYLMYCLFNERVFRLLLS